MWEAFGSDDSDGGGPKNPAASVATARGANPAPTLVTEEAWRHLLPETYGPAPLNEPCTVADQILGGTAPPPLFQSRAIRFTAGLDRGGGRGFVASEDIPPGTLLLAEIPVASMPSAEESDRVSSLGEGRVRREELCVWGILQMPEGKREAALAALALLHPRSLDELPAATVAALAADHAASVKALLAFGLENEAVDGAERPQTAAVRSGGPRVLLRLLCALRMNAFDSGVCIHGSMFNHSCAPSTVKLSVGGAVPRSEVWSTEAIAAGEEIMINYLGNWDLSRGAQRLARLQKQFAFDCHCWLCQSGDESKASSLELDALPKHGDAALAAEASLCDSLVEWEALLSQSPLLAPKDIFGLLASVLEAVADALRQGVPKRHLTVARANRAAAAAASKVLADGAIEKAAGWDSVRLHEALLTSLLEVRLTQVSVLGRGPHPDAGAVLSDIAQCLAALLAEGDAGAAALVRAGASSGLFGTVAVASRLERACVQAVQAIARVYAALPAAYVAACDEAAAVNHSLQL